MIFHSLIIFGNKLIQKKSPRNAEGLRVLFVGISVAAAAEESEQVEEEVDKVEIERQGAYSGEAAVGHGTRLCPFLHFLCVIGCEADEYQHACGRDYPVEHAIGPEEVDHDADNEAEEGHVEERTDFREVVGGEVAVYAHRAKHSGCDKECLEDGVEAVGAEYQREHHTVEHRVEVEQSGGHTSRHALDASRDGVDHHQLNDEQAPVYPGVGGEEVCEPGDGSDSKRCGCGHEQGEEHL